MLSFGSFLRRLHRRSIIVRMIEGAGIGLLLGCGMAAMLLPVMIWRGQDSAPAISIFLIMGALVGMAVGWVRRPSALAAAIEADRQLSQDDLLATALLTTASADEWSAAVIASAEARCRALSPNAIVLHRLGARAWGGIGLSAALLITVSLIFAQPDTIKARRTPTPAQSADDHSASATSAEVAGTSGPPSISGARTTAATSSQDHPLETSRDSTANDVSTASPGTSRRTADSASTGGGAAQTAEAAASFDRLNDRGVSSARPANDGKGSATFGAGRSTAETSDTATGEGVVAIRQNVARTPPWRSADWSGDRALAEQMLRSRAVPDEYRDVLRAYFDVEGEPASRIDRQREDAESR